MRLRNTIFMAALAILMAGCVITPRPAYRDYDQPHDEDYYDYRTTPSYEGYYYVRIIFIGSIPYFVDDDRYIRPIPRRLYGRFRSYPYSSLGRPPVFSRDTEVRDGYPVSRIIYFDGVPYNVGNDRIAQPLPERVQPHFRYTPANQGNANGNRPRPPAQHDNGRSNEPPVTALDQLRKGMQQPPQTTVPGQPEGGRDTTLDSKGRLMLSPESRDLRLRRDRPQTAEGSAGKKAGKKPNKKIEDRKSERQKSERKKKSNSGKKDKQGDDTRSDEDSDQKDNGKHPRNINDDQGGTDRGYGDRRD